MPLLLCLLALPAAAQQVLVQADVAADTLAPRTGPNRRYFGHLYLGGGLVAGPPAGAGAAVRYGPFSGEVQIGARGKLRLSQPLAVVADLRYAYLRYALAQTAAKTVPAPAPRQAETLALHQAQIETGLRLNAGARGNSVGRYLDLLAWGSAALSTEYRADDPPPPGASSAQVIIGTPAYLRRTGAGLGARLGSGRYAVVARHRLTPAWTAAYAAWPELPRWVLGLEVGWF